MLFISVRGSEPYQAKNPRVTLPALINCRWQNRTRRGSQQQQRKDRARRIDEVEPQSDEEDNNFGEELVGK